MTQQGEEQHKSIAMGMTRSWMILAAAVLLFHHVLADEETKQPEDGQTEQEEEAEPWLGTLDYLLLAILGAGSLYWFYGRQKKEEPKMPSYVIQPTLVPNGSAPTQDKGFVTKARPICCRMRSVSTAKSSTLPCR